MLLEQVKIFAHYGYRNQLHKLVEELRELETVILYDTENVEHIQEEMADVLNLIEQFMYGNQNWFGKILDIEEFKVKRQIERIEQELEKQQWTVNT